jgi:4-hydroxy-tetrahydrodipicolinate synthase
MGKRPLKEYLKGVAFTTTTPFTEDGEEVVYDELSRIIRSVMAAGGRTFIPCGNTGEFHSLTREERVQVVETSVETVGDEGAVIAGVGGSQKSVIEHVREYERAGIDGVMIHDLGHTYVHREGIVDYYRGVAASTDLDIVLYKRSGKLSLPVVSELSGIKNVVGLKFAVNDVDEFSRVVQEVSDDIVLSCGIAERFAPSFAMEGAEGFTTGIGSFVPEVSLALQDALERGDWERALEIRDLARPYENLRDGTGPGNSFTAANNVPAVKRGLEMAGLYGGPVRPPIVPLSPEDERRAEKYYDRLTESDVAR